MFKRRAIQSGVQLKSLSGACGKKASEAGWGNGGGCLWAPVRARREGAKEALAWERVTVPQGSPFG